MRSLPGAILLLTLFFVGCKNGRPVKPEDAARGEVIFNSSGCPLCHSLKGEQLYGPPLNNILGKDQNVVRNGKLISVRQDRKFIIRSIKDPDSEKAEGYLDRKMPIPDLPGEKIDRIADFLIYINTVTKEDHQEDQ